jgi:DNA-binding winged helix-turn-helix (wHTH) protein
LRFGAFTLDGARRQLFKGERPVHLSPKAFELLTLLIERRPAAVTKADIHARLWPKTFVTDVTLASVVAEMRVALEESGRRSGVIRTVRGFGYALAGEVTSEVETSTDPSPTYWIAVGERRVWLRFGDNVLGRDRRAEVWLDSLSVSRRHAVIRFDGQSVTLVDLGSKNGTYLNGMQVQGHASLEDGDEVRVGSVTVVFRNIQAPGTTQTV